MSRVRETFDALPQAWVSPARILASGAVYAPEVTKPLSHFMGADRVAIALAGARLVDLGGCVTAANISAFAGQSGSTCSSKLRLMVRWFEETGAYCSRDSANRCPRGTKHYQFNIPK